MRDPGPRLPSSPRFLIPLPHPPSSSLPHRSLLASSSLPGLSTSSADRLAKERAASAGVSLRRSAGGRSPASHMDPRSSESAPAASAGVAISAVSAPSAVAGSTAVTAAASVSSVSPVSSGPLGLSAQMSAGGATAAGGNREGGWRLAGLDGVIGCGCGIARSLDAFSRRPIAPLAFLWFMFLLDLGGVGYIRYRKCAS